MELGDVLKGIGSIPIAIGKEIVTNPVSFVSNELLGLDDFRRALKYGSQGEFLKMLKSLGAGTFELGSTLIPSGALLKGTKVAPFAMDAARLGVAEGTMIPEMVSKILPNSRKVFGRELPAVSTRILSRIPGATEVVGSNIATRAPLFGLTNAGRRGLQGFRLGELGQWVDAGNAISAGMGAPSLNIGSASQLRNEQAQQMLLERMRLEIARQAEADALLRVLAQGGVDSYAL